MRSKAGALKQTSSAAEAAAVSEVDVQAGWFCFFFLRDAVNEGDGLMDEGVCFFFSDVVTVGGGDVDLVEMRIFEGWICCFFEASKIDRFPEFPFFIGIK